MTLSRRRLVIVSIIVLGIVALVVFALVSNNTTYVRIVDQRSLPTDNTSAPGADINAIELIAGKKRSSFFASAVTTSNLTDGASGTTNAAKDASNALGSPEEEQETKYVSLGIGGEMTLQIDSRVRNGDQLIIYEIGAENGPRAEYYEVFVSKKPHGPWKSLGIVAGPHTFTFGDSTPLP